jgi:hypothetical protein
MCFKLLLHGRIVHYVAFISFFIGLIVCSTVLSLINATCHKLNTQTKVYPKVYQNNMYDNSLHSIQMDTAAFSCVRHGMLCGILQTSLFPMYVLSAELHGQLFCERTQ